VLFEDTIVAIATPPGIGGIAVVRLSGPKSIDIVSKCLSSVSLKPHRATYADFKNPQTGILIDETVVTYFQAPKSYTAEDVIEVSCHGGHYLAEQILRSLLDLGARMAEPGEFTRRAFLNGRIDLSQAEAVADLIASQTNSSHQMALHQLKGELKAAVDRIRGELIDTISLLELELDFSEDEITTTPYDKISDAILRLKGSCGQLVETYRNGKIYRHGILAPIVGKPNAGKSSLLNILLREERALVSDIPGTTRDTIEESISHNGVEIRLVDTAGLRSSEDQIESMGISRAEKVMNMADILLQVIDITDTEPPDPLPGKNDIPVIQIYNKIDLVPETTARQKNGGIYTSALSGQGVTEIADVILAKILGGSPKKESGESVTITNERHRNALNKAIHSLDTAMESVEKQMSSEFIVVDLRSALNALGFITGQTTTDDILNNIFAKFCIGK